jgi:hypothetical protein
MELVIRTGQITAFYLFDVAESIELGRVPELLQAAAAPVQIASKPAIPSYVRYLTPPLQIEGDALGFADVDGFAVRVKIFDYGVISMSLTRPFSGAWDELIGIAHRLSAESALESRAEQFCRDVVRRIDAALDDERQTFLSEDYFVFSISAMDEPVGADQLLARTGAQIAQVLRAETQPLSTQERDEVLRHRISYLADDLVVPTWSSALVYDTDAGVQASLEILEHANSQLLQFRYYDELLDARLAQIYRELETRSAYNRWWPRRYTRAARRVHALFIDVNELTDRTENALKLVGDVYLARVLALAQSRLGVTTWRESVRDKLKTLDEIYRFAVDQTAMERGELLELAIVAILVFELVLFFMGIMK